MMRSATYFVLFMAGFLSSSSLAHCQEFTFQTCVTSNGNSTQVFSFGLREDALPGLDEFDIPAPPPSPDNSLYAHLAMLAPPATIPNQWLADFRPLLDQNLDLTEFWVFELSNDLPGETATIFIDQPTVLPTSYELWLHQPNSVSLPVTVPGTIEISLDASTLIYFWELRIEGSVATAASSWGGIKSLYR